MRTYWHVILFSLLFVSNAFLIYQHFTTSQKVVYVDSSKLLNGYQGMTDARKSYQLKVSVWKANIDTLVQEIQEDLKRYEKENSKMSLKERDLTQQLIQNKQKQLLDYQKATNEKAALEDDQMTKQVLDEINRFIKDYGQKDKRLIILATAGGNIAYANEGIDITDEILEGLNKKYQGQD